MPEYAFHHPATGCYIHLYADVAPAAVIRAINVIPNSTEWEFDGQPLQDWLDAARLSFEPLKKV